MGPHVGCLLCNNKSDLTSSKGHRIDLKTTPVNLITTTVRYNEPHQKTSASRVDAARAYLAVQIGDVTSSGQGIAWKSGVLIMAVHYNTVMILPVGRRYVLSASWGQQSEQRALGVIVGPKVPAGDILRRTLQPHPSDR
jgi:hypothetical protein